MVPHFCMNYVVVSRYAGMRILLLTVIFLICGCSSNLWTYNSPPGHGLMGKEASQKPAVVLESFTSGSGVDSRWSDVAIEMKQAMSRALLKTGKFEVFSNRSEVNQSYPAYLIEVKVTDFMHTSEAPESVRRLSWFTKANDAIVALDLIASDLHSGKIVYSDQVVATVSAGDDEIDQYGSLEFGSYLFWSTPLGRASTKVIDDSIAQLSGLRGSTPGIVIITKYETGNREVVLSNGELLDDGGIYYLCEQDVATREFMSVDDDLGRPLQLRVEKHFFGSTSGWLLSEPADYENITGSTLSKSPLQTQITSQ